jgi:hypothetical protein
MKRWILLSGVLGGALGVPVAAPAQVAPPAAAPAQSSPGPIAGSPAGGRMSIRVRGGQATKKLRYTAPGARLVIEGRSTPFVPGQEAVLEVYRRGRLVASQRAPIGIAGGGGVAAFRLKLRRRGSIRLLVRHAATPQQGHFRSRSVQVRTVVWRAGQGARGRRVTLLQRGLRKLGFAVPVSGRYDSGTGRAVLAFRKTNHLGRDGYATTRVYSRVLRGRGAFRPRFPRAGRHVEFDWSRQVLALVNGARARRVYHASSGKASTPTVFGAFRFYRKEPGTNSHGMLQSNYFIGGYAIHGYPSVPSYPASHGCIRVPNPNAFEIDRQISLGQRIFVYR